MDEIPKLPWWLNLILSLIPGLPSWVKAIAPIVLALIKLLPINKKIEMMGAIHDAASQVNAGEPLTVFTDALKNQAASLHAHCDGLVGCPTEPVPVI